MQVFHIIIIIFTGSIKAAYIEKDLATAPIFYHPDREIEYEISEVEFSYQLDLNTLTKLKKEYLRIADICHSSTNKKPFYSILFNTSSIWNEKSISKPKTKNIINIEPYSIQALKSDFYYFKKQNDSDIKCSTLSSFLEHLHTLNTELKKIDSSLFSTFSSIIPIETLLKDSYNLTSRSKLTSPLDFAHWFNIHIFKYSKIELSITQNYAYVTIKIPLFTHTILSKIFVKPILFDNIPYIYNTQSEYVIEDQIGINYFSNLNENCFYANNKTFCKIPKFQNKCDMQYLTTSSGKFNRNCFSRLPLRNTITQIRNNIYFLIFEPLTINITCNNSLQSIRLFQSSKILNNECNINSSFFTFDQNSVKEYGIFNSNSTENLTEWKIFPNSDLKNIINFYCFFSFLLLYLVTLSVLIFFFYRLRSRNSQQEILESPI